MMISTLQQAKTEAEWMGPQSKNSWQGWDLNQGSPELQIQLRFLNTML